MIYPRVYDLSLDSRIVLGFYTRGVKSLVPCKAYERENRELLERKYIEIKDGKIIVLVKHPRVYKRDERGNLIPMKIDEGKGYCPRWK